MHALYTCISVHVPAACLRKLPRLVDPASPVPKKGNVHACNDITLIQRSKALILPSVQYILKKAYQLNYTSYGMCICIVCVLCACVCVYVLCVCVCIVRVCVHVHVCVCVLADVNVHHRSNCTIHRNIVALPVVHVYACPDQV